MLVEDSSRLEIPLKASPPAPDVHCSGDVDFGRVVADGRMHSTALRLENYGQRPAKYRIVAQSQEDLDALPFPIEIRPTEGEMACEGAPGSAQDIFIGVSSLKPLGRDFAIPYNIEVEGQQHPLQFSVGASLVGHVLKMVPMQATGDGELQQLDIGCIHYSTERVTSALLVNEGPEPVVFSLTPSGFDCYKETPGGGRMLEYNKHEGDYDFGKLPVTITPRQGQIGPHERCVINFAFAPLAAPPEAGWQKEYEAPPRRDYNVWIRAAAIGNDLVHNFELSGSAMAPKFVISNTTVAFPDCEVGQSFTESFKVRNESVQLPLVIHTDPLAHYSMSPMEALVLPGNEQEFTVTFTPKQAGPLSTDLVLNFAERTVKVPLKLQGTCIANAVGLQRSRKYGLATIRKQLKTKTVFRFGFTAVTSMKAQYISGPDGRQTHGIHATANPNVKLRSIEPVAKPYIAMDPTVTLDLASTNKRALERQKYNSYIQGLGTARREHVLTKLRDSPKSANSTGGIGRAPEPLVHVPKTLTRAEEREASLKAKSRALAPPIITVPLAPAQLCKVGPSKHRISFGDVCEGSTNVVDVRLKNSLPQDVCVQLQPNSAELSETSLQPVVIPAHSAIEMQVVLSGISKTTPRNYNTNLTYIINGHHGSSIVTTARIVPPKLLLSTNSVNIPIKSAAQCAHFANALTLSNPLGHAANFRWELASTDDSTLEADHFCVVPAEGTVDPHGSLDCVVQLSPSALMPDTAVFKLHVEDSTEILTLQCCVKSRTPKCRMENTLLLFGPTAINKPSLLQASLHNSGTMDAYFSIGDMVFQPHCPDALEVQPRYGCIRAGESINLQVSYTPTVMCKFSGDFKVNIKNGTPLKVHISGTGVNPDVDVNVEEFFFDKVPGGSAVCRQFSLTNKGNSRVTMSFDLRNQRDFEVFYPHDHSHGTDPDRADVYDTDLLYLGEDEARRGVTQLAWRANSMQCFLKDAHLSPPMRQPYEEQLKVVVQQLTHARAELGLDAVDVTPKGVVFSVDVDAGATLPLLLKFSPRDVAAYDFKLPLAINGLPYGARRVRGTATRMNLHLSERAFDFGNYFLAESDADDSSIDRVLSLKWTGAANEKVFFELRGDPTMTNNAFSVGPRSANAAIPTNTPTLFTFEPQQEMDLVIRFHPTSTEIYNATLAVYMESPSGVFVENIALSGCCTHPFFAFDKLYVDLPTVPFDVTSSVSFNVHAHGYPEGEHEVQWKAPEQTDSFPVQVSFPKGAKFQGPSGSVLVTASFTAPGPISFDAAVDFCDAFGGSFPLRITGRSDSSLLTLYPFIGANPDAYLVTTAEELSAQEYIVSMTSAMHRWFSTFGLPNQVPIDVPESLTADCGRAIFDIIKKQSHRDVPGLTLIRPDRTTPGKMLHTFSLMLKDLTTNGAFLSHVRPQVLLSREHFMAWKHEQLRTQHEAGLSQLSEGQLWISHYAWVEKNYEQLTTEAWTAVCSQILRVFALNYITEDRVTARCGGELPMVGQPMVQQIHCSEEQLLLKWLTHLHQRVTGSSMTVSNFGDDLSDGRVLASVLVAHVPPLAHSYFSDLFVIAESEAQRRHNASRVIVAVRAIGLDEFVVDWSDITSPNPCFLMLFVAFLFRSLAQYAIPDEKIVFSSELHKTVTRSINISNTSNQSLTYRVRIDGTDQFSANKTITVPKNSTRALEVECTPRFYESAEAILLLTGKPSGSARGSVLIFRIETDVLHTTDKPAVNFNATCYSHTRIEIPIKNTLGRAGTFKLSTMLAATGASPPSRKKTTGQKSQRRSITRKVDPTRNGFKENNRTFLWAEVEDVELEAGETKRVTCCVCPTRLGQHRGIILATHPELGQLQVLVGGVSRMPEAIKQLDFKCKVGDDISKTIKIPYVNGLKLSAIQAIPGGIDDPKLTTTLTLATSAGKLLSKEVVLTVNMRAPVSGSGGRVPLDLPTKLNLVPGTPAKDGKLLATHISTGMLVKFKETTDMQIRLNPLQEGKFGCEMVLIGPDDIRVYKVQIDVENPNKGGNVPRAPVDRVIHCRRNAEHTEGFEVVNNSPNEAVFKVSTEWEAGLATGSGTSITIPRGGKYLYQVTLHPRITAPDLAQGFLTFVSGNQHITYNMTIFVEDDEEAAETVLPVQCGAVELSSSCEDAVQMTVALENPFSNDVEFLCSMEGPCADQLFYESTVQMKANTTVDYNVTWQPTGQEYAQTTHTLKLKAVDGYAVAEYHYILNTETLGWKEEWELTLQSLMKRTGMQRDAVVKALVATDGISSRALKLLQPSA